MFKRTFEADMETGKLRHKICNVLEMAAFFGICCLGLPACGRKADTEVRQIPDEAPALNDQNSKSGSMTVVQPQSPGVSLSQSSLSLYPGESRTLAAYLYPTGVVSQSVYWTSSDYTVASVDSYGRVTAYRPGTALISATTPAGALAVCTVRVSSWY